MILLTTHREPAMLGINIPIWVSPILIVQRYCVTVTFRNILQYLVIYSLADIML